MSHSKMTYPVSSSTAIWTCLLLLSLLQNTGALLCDCNEEECLSGDRSNMCVQDKPEYGCYKQYYTKADKPVLMGCVKADLLCRSLGIRPEPYDDEWPYFMCCFTDNCNRHLPLPPHANISESKEVTEPLETVSYPIRIEITDSYKNNQGANTRGHNSEYKDGDISKSDDDQQNAVHPIFVLLLVLVIIFLLVVMASILVIVKIWLYRRRRSKPRKRWIVQQKMNSNTPTSMLLTDPSDSMTTCSDLNTNNSNIVSNYDVP